MGVPTAFSRFVWFGVARELLRAGFVLEDELPVAPAAVD